MNQSSYHVLIQDNIGYTLRNVKYRWYHEKFNWKSIIFNFLSKENITLGVWEVSLSDIILITSLPTVCKVRYPCVMRKSSSSCHIRLIYNCSAGYLSFKNFRLHWIYLIWRRWLDLRLIDQKIIVWLFNFNFIFIQYFFLYRNLFINLRIIQWNQFFFHWAGLSVARRPVSSSSSLVTLIALRLTRELIWSYHITKMFSLYRDFLLNT